MGVKILVKSISRNSRIVEEFKALYKTQITQGQITIIIRLIRFFQEPLEN